jgi:hypothetical protein
MAGNLEYRIGRGIENGLASAHVFFTQAVENFSTRRMAITQIAWQTGPADNLIQQGGGKLLSLSVK